MTEEDLTTPGVVFQMGVAPVRIDVLTMIHGVAFEPAWRERIEVRFAGVPAAVLGST